MPIQKLPTLVVNQIAAGEVIERPASVVKELVENSLDAGARRIDVQIEVGGKELIRIADDGMGISEDELPLAVSPHATSKLQSTDQLECIGTLGFRGEALASIGSVSRLSITSRATVDGKPAESAALIEVAGDQVQPVRPASGSPGTVIEVRDLFFNTPARRKFMRAASTEFGQINEVLMRIAMMHPEVSFRLTHGQRKTFDVPADQTRRDRCVHLLGKELDEALHLFEADQPSTDEVIGASIWGLAGLPSIARSTSKFQYLAINGRPIKDRNLSHAIKESYRGLIPPDKFPLVVVFIDTDPRGVDVNVHPAKTEVRFRDSRRMYSLILHALRQSLLSSDLTPTATLQPSEPAVSNLINRSSESFSPPPATPPATTPDWAPPSSPATSTPAASNPPVQTANQFVDYFKRMDPNQKGFVYEEVRREMREADEEEPSLTQSAWEQAKQQREAPTAPPPVLQQQGVLQIHKSYLVTQDEQGIVIIDQHALHERVMFEELRLRILDGNLESQRLLMPVVLSASPVRIDLLDELQPLLTRIGIEASAMGPQQVGIHAFPTLLFERKVEPDAFLSEVLDKAEDGSLDLTNPGADESVMHEVLDMMACKAAVKAGDGMSAEELAALLVRRDEIERASNCPHGRPTTIRLTINELEKYFKRT